MNYKSFKDLAEDIRLNLNKVPKDIDLIVGVPRSGLVAAGVVSLNLNLKFCDLESFLLNKPLKTGSTRQARADILYPHHAKHILLVDDSLISGNSIKAAKNEIINHGLEKLKITTCVIYTIPNEDKKVDICFQSVNLPRVFEWNLFHREILSRCCVDIDGVLCKDPLVSQNDDGVRYKDFLNNALQITYPTYEIGYLVTSRLEKYRQETERWLHAHEIQYKKLFMLDLPNAAERRRRKCHASFKAEVFSSIPHSRLFIESEMDQAIEISNTSGKHVLCYTNQILYKPGFSTKMVSEVSKYNLRRLTAFLKKKVKIE